MKKFLLFFILFTQNLSFLNNCINRIFFSQGEAQNPQCPVLFAVSLPSFQPTSQPTRQPSRQPSGHPSNQPSSIPTNVPTYYPVHSFSYTGGGQTIKVPVGVSSVYVNLYGAAGESAVVCSMYRKGYGARVRSVLSVISGQVLYIYVGGTGYNGGIPGSSVGDCSHSTIYRSGGGASDIRIGGNALSNRVVSADGGFIGLWENYCSNCYNSAGCCGTGGADGIDGGATSFSNGTSTIFDSGVNTGPGMVYIQFYASPTSQPSSSPSLKPNHPSSQPSSLPSIKPSMHPSSRPTKRPTSFPSSQPTKCPSVQPTGQPASRPTDQPTSLPSRQPSSHPSSQPTSNPTLQPSSPPSSQPISFPSSAPITQPSSAPSAVPSQQPSSQPTSLPSSQPSSHPSTRPSSQPSSRPSLFPTSQPSILPTEQPSSFPSSQPSGQPSSFPTNQPTGFPSVQPSGVPSTQPSSLPSSQPSRIPSGQPSEQPTSVPSIQPSSEPSNYPSSQPSLRPSTQPTSNPSNFPSNQPSGQPTAQPTTQPSHQPSQSPTSQPSGFPSSQPTLTPSKQPTGQPSRQPTCQPSCQPSTFPTSQPTMTPSNQPTERPSGQPTSSPTAQPSWQPSSLPTNQPTCSPTCQPSSGPSNQPTVLPSDQPSNSPTDQPSSLPTDRPSTQPSNCPSKQPSSSPTSRPSTQPTIIPSAQPSNFPTSAPQATIYQTNGVLFYLGATSNFIDKPDHQVNGVLGTSYILFGRNFNHQKRFPFTISLDSPLSREFVSQITDSEVGSIRNDITTRSTTNIGDINGDTFLDLLVGYPLASKCSVYLGDGVNDFATIVSTTDESFAIVGDLYQGGGFLGWSSIRIGDLNGDGIEEIVVAAIYANAVYVIYGRARFDKTININELTNKDGFQIKGSDQETNFGVSLSLLHHFRKGSHADIALTAQRSTAGQCVVYVLFGGVNFHNPESVIAIDRIKNNPMKCLKIVAPLYSYAGFSLAGIGDINSDGYDDLAIGSVPYDRGKYHQQKTYIIYGRKFATNETELDLSQMTEKDGIVTTGGGFLVTGVGDVNGDNVADVMISSYYDWKGQSSAYVITAPINVMYSPSFQPSSAPSTHSPTVKVTVDDNSSFSPTPIPSFRPSNVPTQFSSLTPTHGAFFSIGSARPSAGTTTTINPSLSPTFGYHRLRGFPTASPVLSPTTMPTINTTIYTEIGCSEGKEYHGKNDTNNLFRITANTGTLKLIGNGEGGSKNLYVLYCPNEPLNVVIQNFRLLTDAISVAHLADAGYYYPSLNEISYSAKNGPLTLLFCSENKLQVILSSHNSFDLQDNNFVFTQIAENDLNEHNVGNSILVRVQIGVVCGVFVFLLLVFFTLSFQHKQEEKEKLKYEEEWLNSLTVPLDQLNIHPALENSEQMEARSISSDETLITNQSEEEAENLVHNSDIGNVNMSNNNTKLYDDDFEAQPIPLNEFLDGNNEPMNPENSNSNQEILSDGEPHSSSSSSSSLSEEESLLSFEIKYDKKEIEEKKKENEKKKEDCSSNVNDDKLSSINSEDWKDALVFSDDEDET
jgi:hypothetical protein